MDETRGLWRGKRVDNGEWAYGNYVYHSFVNGRKHYVGEPFKLKEVDPSTLGECTGLTDKNSKLVFEGDIVNCKSIFDNANMVVIFEYGQFRMVCAEDYSSYQTDSCYYNINCFEKEIIGNIHDNPDLLTPNKT
ncbi:MAG: YopX family protein [Oscillospiraceae bacterium]|nr:YopX family protein [Oscillospiraceae bacterium]